MTADLAPTRTGTAALGGVTLAYRERGEPGDPPVVLLHGGFSRASTWDTFAAALAEAGRHAIALELRGHGGSSHPGEYSVSLMADDLAAFLDHRGLARVDLVGHPLGGLVAWRCTLQWPDRVRRLVIEDAPPPPREVRVEDGSPEPPAEPPEPVDFDWEAGHHIHRERPLEFAQTVLPFLADG